MRTILGLRPSWFAVGALIVGASCSEPTSAPSAELATHRSRWVARHPAAYQYEYLVTGFLMAYEGHRLRLVVRDGVVQSATDIASGQAVPGAPAQWPTIDQLFDDAAQAAAAGTLRRVQYDSAYDYPAEIDLAGPPDASGSLMASALTPLP